MLLSSAAQLPIGRNTGADALPVTSSQERSEVVVQHEPSLHGIASVMGLCQMAMPVALGEVHHHALVTSMPCKRAVSAFSLSGSLVTMPTLAP